MCSSRGGTALISVRNRHSLSGGRFRRALSREQVPNQGPFVPLAARDVRAMVAARFSIAHEAGISLGVEGDGKSSSGRCVICRASTRCGSRRVRDERDQAAPARIASPIRRS